MTATGLAGRKQQADSTQAYVRYQAPAMLTEEPPPPRGRDDSTQERTGGNA